ncbi:MAG: hybrid sensor histidine kinase/response regulator [Candidatus Wallbacteria bacterium HGW-Wallbacteria-1]|jgi:ligand-binding sensor protein/CheY-like chemotaxis protein|uniref:histidine kinase n=1 Tax=Candidatus Wallbacteria bacterium HGW-Wallbacteria-1 TaxID=2013854 RepID=A0A2N1PLZ1_9BACT|nr:MAG: hybrid sensor histidine kinase/response regulator [Candidatus Wallbacteria bacterium HGW-Wallbacteria-1]
MLSDTFFNSSNSAAGFNESNSAEFSHVLSDEVPDPIQFDELFDLQDIQLIQDEFAAATGVASIITRPDGTPFTKPSNFCRMCIGIIRNTEKGCANCFKSDAMIGRFNPDGPTIQQCLSGGLWDAGAAISVGGRHIANWLIGQVRNEAQTGPELSIHENLQDIRKAAEHSADLTRQLLAFARKQAHNPIMLDLNSTIGDMLNMLRRLISEDIELAWIPGSQIWPVLMDPSQITQILTNLCINARDAINGGGKIIIETSVITFHREHYSFNDDFRPGDFVVLSVSDNGPGMDKKTLNNLFEPFFTTKKKGSGTGLGLSTVYGILNQNKGFINVYSEPGQGSVFKIYLPRYNESKPELPQMESRVPVTSGNETILMVEDEPAMLKLGSRILKHIGYSVLTAANPDEALQMAGNYRQPIHLLVTDVILPGMKGPELAEKMAELFPGLKILLMSGYSDCHFEDQKEFSEKINFIQKPFSIQDLGARVREILDQ